MAATNVVANEEVTVIAHRGASADAPENTRASIAEAVRVGAPVIEFDVRATADGTLVLFHDDNLERITGRKGSVETNDWKVIRELDVGSWFDGGEFDEEKPMLLADAIKLCLKGDSTPLIEHKTGEAADYVKAIQDLNAGEKVILQSFNWDFLAEVQSLDSSIPLGALGSKELDASRKTKISKLKPDWVGWKFSDFRDADLKWAKSRGFEVALWTVNDAKIASSWAEKGVSGIITDKPAQMLQVLGDD